MSRPDPLVLIALVAALLGLGIVAGAFGVPFSLRSAFVTLVGLLALLQGLRYAAVRRSTPRRATDVEAPERRHRVPVPGDDVDEQLDVAGGWRGRGVTVREKVRDRLRAALVETLVLRENYTEATATDLVDEGTWTDDPVAAAFVAGDPPPFSLRRRFALFVSSESAFRHAAARTIRAIDDLGRDESTAGTRERSGASSRDADRPERGEASW